MKGRKYRVLLAAAGALWVLAGNAPMTAWAGGQTGGQTDRRAGGQTEASVSVPDPLPGWNQDGGRWYWLTQDGNLYKGWLQTAGRTYYLDEDGTMATGWREVEGEWYYFHEDGGMNLGELILDNGVYEFSDQGALVSAGWVENTGGGAYSAGCYDDTAQDLFDQLNEEKKDLYFEEHPDREDEYDGDMHRVYDRYAGFRMDMALNKAAAHRLEAAAAAGYADDRIPGEGSVGDYLAAVNYRRNASCQELYVRDCEDAAEAYDKVTAKLDKRYESKTDRRYSLEYYRRLGMAHEERDGKHYFMIILMR